MCMTIVLYQFLDIKFESLESTRVNRTAKSSVEGENDKVIIARLADKM